jgi:hypothetical protein
VQRFRVFRQVLRRVVIQSVGWLAAARKYVLLTELNGSEVGASNKATVSAAHPGTECGKSRCQMRNGGCVPMEKIT